MKTQEPAVSQETKRTQQQLGQMEDHQATSSVKPMLLITFIVATWFAALYVAVSIPPMERKVDCSLAEFHPDYTPEMRQACREARRVKV